MSTASDIDSAMAALIGAIQAHVAAGGDARRLTAWMISQLKQSDQRVANALILSVGQFVANPPDRRPFAEVA